MEHKHARAWELDPAHLPLLREGMALKPWQHLGITFLHYCRMKFGYGCLADEMGVGKVYCSFAELTDCLQTIQTLGCIYGIIQLSRERLQNGARKRFVNFVFWYVHPLTSPFCLNSDLNLDSGMTPVSEAFRVNPESIQSQSRVNPEP